MTVRPAFHLAAVTGAAKGSTSGDQAGTGHARDGGGRADGQPGAPSCLWGQLLPRPTACVCRDGLERVPCSNVQKQKSSTYILM